MSQIDLESTSFEAMDGTGEAPTNVDWLAMSPRPRTGGCSRALMGLGVGCFLLILLSCAGLFVSGALLQQYAKNLLCEDPEKVTAMASEIAPIEIPGGLTPKLGLDVKVPVTGKPVMKWAVFADEPSQSVLMLCTFSEEYMPKDEAQARRQLEQSLQGQGMSSELMEVADTRERTFLIRGEPARFTLARGKDRKTGGTRFQLTGMFKGLTGPALLVTNVDRNVVDERALGTMLLSLKE
jgi:hypothetical protein